VDEARHGWRVRSLEEHLRCLGHDRPLREGAGVVSPLWSTVVSAPKSSRKRLVKLMLDSRMAELLARLLGTPELKAATSGDWLAPEVLAFLLQAEYSSEDRAARCTRDFLETGALEALVQSLVAQGHGSLALKHIMRNSHEGLQAVLETGPAALHRCASDIRREGAAALQGGLCAGVDSRKAREIREQHAELIVRWLKPA